jgi:AraC-like DNA-binding protein
MAGSLHLSFANGLSHFKHAGLTTEELFSSDNESLTYIGGRPKHLLSYHIGSQPDTARIFYIRRGAAWIASGQGRSAVPEGCAHIVSGVDSMAIHLPSVVQQLMCHEISTSVLEGPFQEAQKSLSPSIFATVSLPQDVTESWGMSTMPILSAFASRRYKYAILALTNLVTPDPPKIVELTREQLSIKRLADEIAQDPARDWSLTSAADFVGYSPRAFSKLFAEVTDRTFGEYLEQCRVGLATKLLSDPNLSLAEVAVEAGFSSLTILRRKWKEILGVPPSSMRDFFLSNL